ncbi:LysR family transcriptional regulator [Legionella waltersii]|uniref:Transcriptional regulator n=1 Tax=Legionella waltersii TaxID=66969 RepID=A0A0W1AP13_9GAMM|nr:LysR family transcriptional regulator [Legionella waltersii]KTD83050.1 transcriptional regulator [Legionella waltersii]SNU97523.1 transcriptional regulator [Legionella waltersii]
MSKLEQINAFISVVEQNGFAAAARKEGVSTAAISRQVTRLESDLKVELLIRTTRQVSLTEIGMQYYQQSKKALAELAEAEMAISESQGEPTGILNVISSRYFAVKNLLPKLPEFMALNPKLRVNVELAERFPNLAEENIDLIFGVSMEGPSTLVRRRVATTRYILCASPFYIEKYGEPHTPAQLSNHQYITHSMRKPDNVVKFKSNKEIYVEPILWLNDSRAMCECAIQGMGIVWLHDYIVADAIEDGRLIEILPEFCENYRPVYLYYQQSRYLQPKIRRFIDFYTSEADRK